jgi:hypothetical protein
MLICTAAMVYLRASVIALSIHSVRDLIRSHSKANPAWRDWPRFLSII